MSEKSGFIWAVRTGDVKGVQDGLSKGENVNQVDETVNRRTPLHHAADFGHAEVLQMLIAKGADVPLPIPSLARGHATHFA
jgi:ankyrin repeat protein